MDDPSPLLFLSPLPPPLPFSPLRHGARQCRVHVVLLLNRPPLDEPQVLLQEGEPRVGHAGQAPVHAVVVGVEASHEGIGTEEGGGGHIKQVDHLGSLEGCVLSLCPRSDEGVVRV